MKRSTKIAVLLACVLILAGIALSFGTVAGIGFDLANASMTPMVTNYHTVTEEFTSIRVNGGECSVTLLPSEDSSCKIELIESKKIFHEVKVTNGVLIVNRIDEQKWYDHLGIYFYPFEVNIYLPQKSFDSLEINVGSGDIRIPADFSFRNIRLSTASGSIEAHCAVENTAYMHNISGSIDLRNISCLELTAQTISGSVFAWDCTGNTVDLQTTSGHIGFYNGDGTTITMKTVSGNINANLRTGKTFAATTVSGSITVPANTPGGECSASTVSGDIYIVVE